MRSRNSASLKTMGHFEQLTSWSVISFPSMAFKTLEEKTQLKVLWLSGLGLSPATAHQRNCFVFLRILTAYFHLITTTYCFWNSLCLLLRRISLSFLSENLEEIKGFNWYFHNMALQVVWKDKKTKACGSL